MAESRYICKYDPYEENWHQYFGTPYYSGIATASGTLRSGSIAGDRITVDPSLLLNIQACSTDNPGTGTMFFMPMFPSATIPRRFLAEMSFTPSGDWSANQSIFLLVGNQITSHNDPAFRAWGIGISPLNVLVRVKGTSVTLWPGLLDAASSYFDATDFNLITTLHRLVETRTNTPATDGDIQWRVQNFPVTSRTNNMFGDANLIQFTGTYVGCSGSTYNKLYLGYQDSVTSASLPNSGFKFSKFNIRKHPLDEGYDL